MVVGVVGSLVTQPESDDRIDGLVSGRMDGARRRFKGTSEIKTPSASPLRTLVASGPAAEPDVLGRLPVSVSQDLAGRLDVVPGDLVFAEHPNPMYGGLRSGCFRVAEVGDFAGLEAPPEALEMLGRTGGDQVKIWRWM
jgi:hypothetical protein